MSKTTEVILSASGALILLGVVVFFLLQYHNTQTLKNTALAAQTAAALSAANRPQAQPVSIGGANPYNQNTGSGTQISNPYSQQYADQQKANNNAMIWATIAGGLGSLGSAAINAWGGSGSNDTSNDSTGYTQYQDEGAYNN